MQEPVTQAIANGISMLFALLGISEAAEVFNLLITVIALVWIVKRVFRISSNRKRSKKEDDWLYRAQRHQQDMYAYSDPVSSTQRKQKHTKPQKPTRKASTNGLVSPTGWVYDEEKGEWTPPKSLQREANTRWEWNEEKRIWIDKAKRK